MRFALWRAGSYASSSSYLMAHRGRLPEGKPHGTALGAVCHKLITRVYIVLKENRPYEVRTQH